MNFQLEIVHVHVHVLALSTNDQHSCYMTKNLTKKTISGFFSIKMLTCANQNLEVVTCISLKKKRKPVGDCQGWSQCFTGAVTYGKFSIPSLSNSVTSTLLGYSPLVYMSE